jgi:hypothetical protein
MSEESFWYLLVEAFFHPTHLLKWTQNPLKSKKISTLIWFIALLFALYGLAFTFKERIWHISSDDSLYPYHELIDFITLFFVCIILFGVWYYIDAIPMKLIFYKTEIKTITPLMLAIHSPWILLMPMYTILRIMFANEYAKWGVLWIAYFNITLYLGWHYLNVVLLTWKAAKMAHREKIAIIILIGLLMVIGGLLITFFFVLPVLFDATPEKFLQRAF